MNSIDLLIDSTLLSKVFTYDDSSVPLSFGNSTSRIYSVEYKKNGSFFLRFTYTYDANQNITSITVSNQNGSTEYHKYYYDGFNQLLREDYRDYIGSGSFTKKFSYDNNGNISSIKKYNYNNPVGLPLEHHKFTYSNAWKDQITRIDYYVEDSWEYFQTLTYDESGNLTSYNDKTYSWDGKSLVGITDGYGYGTTYKYNDQGIRTQKTVINGAGDIITDYVLDGNKVLVESNSMNTIYYTYDYNGTLLSMNLNGNDEYFYLTNLQGDVIGLVDEDGIVVVTYQYDAWGKMISSTDTSGIGLATKNPYRYRGYRYDVETSLYYCNSRYYNPEWGRWLNADDVSC